MINYGLNPLEQVRLRFASALREYMMQHGLTRRGTISAKTLARIIHVSPKTIEGWLSGEAPRWDHFWRLVAYFGPDFMSEILEPIGMTCAVISDDGKKGRA